MMDPSQFKDYYKILGVAPSAESGEIKKTFRRLAREYHPDVNKAPGSESRFKEISAAYDVLGDENKRQEYDTLYRYMQNGGPQSHTGRTTGSRSARQPDGGFNFEFGNSGFSGDMEDIFNRFFGAQNGQNPFSRSRSGGFAFSGGHGCGGGDAPFNSSSHCQTAHKKPPPPKTRMDISLEDAFQGCKRPMEVRLGQETKRIVVTIPPGITNGQTIRIGGGTKGSDTLPNEFLIEVNIVPHRLFRLQQRDVELELPISPWEAALGCQITVPTLGGSVRMRIPANSQSGHKLSLRGKGLPGSPAGNQTVVLRIVTPEATSPAHTEAYQQFSQKFSFNPREGFI